MIWASTLSVSDFTQYLMVSVCVPGAITMYAPFLVMSVVELSRLNPVPVFNVIVLDALAVGEAESPEGDNV